MNIVLQISITAIMSKLEQVKVHIYVRTYAKPVFNTESDLEIQTIVKRFLCGSVAASQLWFLAVNIGICISRATCKRLKLCISR